MSTYTFFLGKHCLGTMPATPLVHEVGQPPIFTKGHKAFCCPVCGEIWARILTDYAKASWHFEHRPCRQCDLRNGAPWMSQAGTFLDPSWWHSDFLITNPALPDAVVRWEFQGIVPIIEKELANEYRSQAVSRVAGFD